MRETPNTTALLIEYGFIDNPSDQRKLTNNITDYAEGVVKAVSEYIGVPYTFPGEIDEGDFYTVKRGDTLYSIALKYNTSVDELKRLNNLISNNLMIGQKLQIPTSNMEEEYTVYTVKNGDTLYSISKEYGITPNDIIDYNNLGTTVLTIGQSLKIPKSSFIPETDKYIVKRGDTLYLIASKYNTTVDAIKAFNNLTSNTLSIGQILQIPSNIIETEYQTYVIKSGDTLYSIARMFNTTPNKILELNDVNPSNLRVGFELKIPNN